MTLPVERKLRGEPIPRKQLIAEWEDPAPAGLTKRLTKVDAVGDPLDAVKTRKRNRR